MLLNSQERLLKENSYDNFGLNDGPNYPMRLRSNISKIDKFSVYSIQPVVLIEHISWLFCLCLNLYILGANHCPVNNRNGRWWVHVLVSLWTCQRILHMLFRDHDRASSSLFYNYFVRKILLQKIHLRKRHHKIESIRSYRQSHQNRRH